MSSKHIHCHPTSGFRCDAVPSGFYSSEQPNAVRDAAGDPATLIGLALSFARQRPFFAGDVPSLILDRLAHHAEHENPACRMVLDWLDRRHRMKSTAAPEAQANRRRQSVHDRVLQALAAVPELPDEERLLRHRRKRREPLAETISTAIGKAKGETSHG
jgi:hypothetical protein